MTSLETTVVLLAIIFVMGAILNRAHSDLHVLSHKLAVLQIQVTILQQMQTNSEDEEGKMKSIINEHEDLLELVHEAHITIIDVAQGLDEDIDWLWAKADALNEHDMELTTRIETVKAELATLKIQLDQSCEADKEDKLTLIESISAMNSKIENKSTSTDTGFATTLAKTQSQLALKSGRTSTSRHESSHRQSKVASVNGKSFRGFDACEGSIGSYGVFDVENKRERRKQKLRRLLRPTTKVHDRKDSGYGEDDSEIMEQWKSGGNDFYFNEGKGEHGGSVVE